MPSDLTHFDEDGNARMVDITGKQNTDRFATASGTVTMQPETLQRIVEGTISKGDVLAVARLAGILAAKQTDRLIPLCHSLPLESVELQFEPLPPQMLKVQVTVACHGKTGVEMEALHAVSVALLTIYDMCKAIDRGMQIDAIRLESKRGGRSGTWQRNS